MRFHAPASTATTDWEESEHPRDDQGRFASSGGRHSALKPEGVYSALASAEDSGGAAKLKEVAAEIMAERPDLIRKVISEAADLGYRLDPPTQSKPGQEGDAGDKSKRADEGEKSSAPTRPDEAIASKFGWVQPEQIAAAREIAEAARTAGTRKLGLRVIPPDYAGPVSPGAKLEASYKWKNGERTSTKLDGVSTIRLDGADVNSVLSALHLLGMLGKSGPNGYYQGGTVVLVKGASSRKGEDQGEAILGNPEIVQVWKSPPQKGEYRGVVRPNRATTTDRASILVAQQIGRTQALTPEGFLFCEGVRIARTGPMLYRPDEVPDISPADGVMVTVTRDAEALFEPDAIASFAGKPVTNDHPNSMVTPASWRSAAVGVVLNPRRGEGAEADYLLADLLITDADAIRDVQAGKREVSCGYDAEYEQIKPGLGRQLNIRGNHVALVDRGRAGPSCAIQDRETNPMARRTVWDRLRTAFKAKDEAAFEEEIEAAQKDTEADEPQRVVIEVKVPEAAASEDEQKPAQQADAEGGDLDARIVAALNTIIDRLNEIDEDLYEEDPAAQETRDLEGYMEGGVFHSIRGSKGYKRSYAGEPRRRRRRSRDAEPESIVPEERDGERGPTMDAAALRSALQDTAARAEILAPGIGLPTFDARAGQRATLGHVRDLQRRALAAAAADAVRGPIVKPVLAGRDVATMPAEVLGPIFIAASELARAANNARTTRTLDNAPGNAATGGMSPVEYQRLIEQRRKRASA